MNFPGNVIKHGTSLILELIMFGFWYGVRLIPESIALKFARPLGMIIRTNTKRMTLKKMRSVLETSTENEDTWTAPWRSNASHVATVLIELIHLERNTLEKLRQRVSISGEHHLQTSLASGRAVMLFLNHLGNIGYTVGGLAARVKHLTVIGNPVWVSFFERKLQKLHRVVGARRVLIGDGLPQAAADVFRHHGIFATFIDYTVVEKHNAEMKLGNASVSINMGPAIIALRNKVDVLCVSCLRNEDGTHTMTIHAPLAPTSTGNIQHDAITLMENAMKFFETELLANPEQWWTWNYARIQ